MTQQRPAPDAQVEAPDPRHVDGAPDVDTAQARSLLASIQARLARADPARQRVLDAELSARTRGRAHR